MRTELEALYNTLRSTGMPAGNIQLRITSDGAHSEWYWARELPESFKWLYKPNSDYQRTIDMVPFLIKTNKKQTTFKLQTRRIPDQFKIEITGQNGEVLKNITRIKRKKIKIDRLSKDASFLNLYLEGKLVNCIKL